MENRGCQDLQEGILGRARFEMREFLGGSKSVKCI